jgi:hypothetical protein
MRTKVAIIPIEVQQSGLFTDLVFLIPGGFTTQKFLQDWKKTLAATTKKGSCFHLDFADCTHQLVRGLDQEKLIEIVSFLLNTSTPVIITLRTGKVQLTSRIGTHGSLGQAATDATYCRK